MLLKKYAGGYMTRSCCKTPVFGGRSFSSDKKRAKKRGFSP